MLEFIYVPHADAFPQKCVSCDSQPGPFVLTHRMLNPWGTVYICKRCAKTCARVMGFMEGKRLDELEHAIETEVAAVQEVQEHQELSEMWMAESESWKKRWEED